METQNITLSIPKEVLRRVKMIAAQRQTSVSGLVTQALEGIVEQEQAYSHARRRHLESLENAANLGTCGLIQLGREECHECS